MFIGAEPNTTWIPDSIAKDEHGYVLTGAELVQAGKWPLKNRAPCPLETSIPRLLAGGDVRSGSTKRVGFAVGDGSLAVAFTITSARSIKGVMGMNRVKRTKGHSHLAFTRSSSHPYRPFRRRRNGG